MITLQLNPNEARVIEILRELKTNQRTQGYGHLLVEVKAGIETRFEPHHSEQPPMKKNIY